MNMVCHQRTAGAALKIGCIGDSITAGAHSSGPTKTYPAQLQAMLDPSAYAVTNLGACGSTMQKNADSPYWKRPQFTTLTSNKVRCARGNFSRCGTLSHPPPRSVVASPSPHTPLAVGHHRHHAGNQ
jgi:hypothetical protein